MQKKLAFLTLAMHGGGAERVLRDIANYTAQQGNLVDLILCKKEGPYLAEIDPSIRVIALSQEQFPDHIPLFNKLLWLARLVRYLNHEQPRALLSTLRTPNSLAAIAGKLSSGKTKIILREATVMKAELASRPPLTRFFRRLKVRLTYPLADNLVVMSEAMANEAQEVTGIAPEKCIIIPNPAVTPAMLQQAQEPVAHPWFSEDSLPVITAAGRLGHEKGYDLLLNAFTKLRQKTDCRLYIMGEGEERPKLEALIEKLNLSEYVSLAGFEANPFAYLTNSNCFVLPSRFEGFPNALIQAMACGCPVVVTDCSDGVREILGEPPIGALVPCENADALAEAMHQTLLNPPDRDTLKHHAEKYHIDHCIGQYAELMGFEITQPSQKAAAS